MQEKTFLSSHVASIAKLTGRQVISWTEKGLVIPFKDSSGTGIRREYNYVNLLEFGLCKELFLIGLGVSTVKKILNELNEVGAIRAWAIDLFQWFDKASELNAYLDTHEKVRNPKTREELDRLDIIYKNLFHDEPRKQDKPYAILAYFFGSDGKPGYEVRIFPWKIDKVLTCDEIKEGFINSRALLFIDMGKIKEEIDKEL